jgi:hypothetical protein
MAQYKKGDPHGMHRVQIALVGDDGFAYGTVGQDAANDTELPMYVARYPKSCDMPLPDRTVIDFMAADTWQGSFMYGITSMGSFTLTMSGYDADMIALVTDSAVDLTTNTEWVYFSENIMVEDLPQICIWITYRIQVRGGAADGAAYFITSMIPRCWMAPKGVSGAPANQAAGEYPFQITPTVSSVLPSSLSLANMAMSLQDERAPIVHIISQYPLMGQGFVGDAAATTMTMPYLPVSATVTINASPNEYIVAGTPTALTSMVPATGVATFPSAPTAGQFVFVTSETRWAALP